MRRSTLKLGYLAAAAAAGVALYGARKAMAATTPTNPANVPITTPNPNLPTGGTTGAATATRPRWPVPKQGTHPPLPDAVRTAAATLLNSFTATPTQLDNAAVRLGQYTLDAAGQDLQARLSLRAARLRQNPTAIDRR